MDLKSYRELIVWQKAIELIIDVYSNTKKFPKEEVYGLTAQMRRACVSVACNIAEGQSRNTTGEFKQFFGISKGSLSELETLLLISLKMNYLNNRDHALLESKCNEIGKLLNGLIRSLSK